MDIRERIFTVRNDVLLNAWAELEKLKWASHIREEKDALGNYLQMICTEINRRKDLNSEQGRV